MTGLPRQAAASGRPAAVRLEGLIALARREPAATSAAAAALAEASVWALGARVHSSSGILHALIDERTLVPVFTRVSFLAEGIRRNPMWASLAVLEVRGGDLMNSVSGDAAIVVNPWSPLEMDFVRREPGDPE